MNWKKIHFPNINVKNKKYRGGLVFGLLLLCLTGLLFMAAQSIQLKVPRELHGRKVNAGTIRLSWNPVPGCDGYVISRYSRGNGKMEEIARIRSAKVTVYEDDVNANRKQRYTVAAYQTGSGGGLVCSRKGEITVGGLTGYETIGHRGAMDLAPDDTIASFNRARRAGYTTFECDMFYTDSGDLFIFHDPELEPLTGKGGSPSKLSQDNYLMYPILYGKNSNRYPAQYPPDLNELLAWGRDHDMRIIIHIKILDVVYDDKAFSMIEESLEKYDMKEKVLFFTSDYKVSARMADFDFRKGFLTSFTSKEMRRNAIQTAKKNQCELVIMKYSDQYPVTADINRLAHEKGLKTVAYNIKRWDQIAFLINSRTDYWITNRVLVRSGRKQK